MRTMKCLSVQVFFLTRIQMCARMISWIFWRYILVQETDFIRLIAKKKKHLNKKIERKVFLLGFLILKVEQNLLYKLIPSLTHFAIHRTTIFRLYQSVSKLPLYYS